MKKPVVILLFCFLCMAVEAQRNRVFSDRIESLKVTVDGDWRSLPVLELGSGKRVSISFDDLTHEYHRYTYRVEHMEADWSPSEGLFERDYMEGFSEGETIDDYAESISTYTDYTNYLLEIPSERCRLKMSGNYRVSVYDDNNGGELMLQACFMVAEPRMSVGLGVTGNTDVGFNNAHQQVEMQVGFGNVSVTDPQGQIRTVVMQNRRWDNARWDARPAIVMPTGLKWTHCRDYVFDGGNEYRKYEILDVTHPTMGIDRIRWDEGMREYHVWPFTQEPRRNYVYDPDADGAFLIRNSDNYESDTRGEYVWVHYLLLAEEPLKEAVYINGDFTGGWLSDRYRMEYDAEAGGYTLMLRQKMGYYNYQYLTVDGQGKVRPYPTEGSFWQTQNSYQALVYFRGPTDRTDRLVGYGEFNNVLR